MKRLVTIFAVLILIASSTALYSQQVPMVSQYKLNGFIYNPALAGVEQAMIVSLLARDQWAGYDKSPRTLWANCHTRLSNKRMGVGGSIYTDRDGLANNTGIQGMYSYHIPMDKAQLSFGASFAMYQFKLNKNDMLARDPMDPLVFNAQRYYAPEAGVGVFYKTISYYGGLSIGNLFQSKMKIAKHDLSDVSMKRVYYLSGGYVYKYNNEITLEPHMLMRYTQGYKAQVDVNLVAQYLGVYWAGVGYRTSKDMLFFVGAIYKNYLFGYAFDYSFTDLHKKSFSSHEIMASMRFGKSSNTRFQGSDIY